MEKRGFCVEAERLDGKAWAKRGTDRLDEKAWVIGRDPQGLMKKHELRVATVKSDEVYQACRLSGLVF